MPVVQDDHEGLWYGSPPSYYLTVKGALSVLAERGVPVTKDIIKMALRRKHLSSILIFANPPPGRGRRVIPWDVIVTWRPKYGPVDTWRRWYDVRATKREVQALLDAGLRVRPACWEELPPLLVLLRRVRWHQHLWDRGLTDIPVTDPLEARRWAWEDQVPDYFETFQDGEYEEWIADPTIGDALLREYAYIADERDSTARL